MLDSEAAVLGQVLWGSWLERSRAVLQLNDPLYLKKYIHQPNYIHCTYLEPLPSHRFRKPPSLPRKQLTLALRVVRGGAINEWLSVVYGCGCSVSVLNVARRTTN